jgi:hypothetical protein
VNDVFNMVIPNANGWTVKETKTSTSTERGLPWFVVLLWCGKHGQPLILSRNGTGLKKSQYHFPLSTFHLPIMLPIDSIFLAGLSKVVTELFFFSIPWLLPLSCWAPLFSGLEIDAGRWMAGAIKNWVSNYRPWILLVTADKESSAKAFLTMLCLGS